MFIKKLWRGEYSLAKTYWGFGVLGNALLGIPLSLIDSLIHPILFIGCYLVSLLYAFIIVGAVWNSASQYAGPAIWRLFAKGISVISGLAIAGSLVLMGAVFRDISFADIPDSKPAVVEPCKLYWNGKEFKKGSASDLPDFTTFTYGRYGVTAIVVSYPNEMLKSFGYIKGETKTPIESNPEYSKFYKDNWSKAANLCGYFD